MHSHLIELDPRLGRLAPAAVLRLRTLLAGAARRVGWPGSPPPTPALHDPSSEAAAVRALAHSYSKTDPRFASELYAAADRHELAAAPDR